MNEEKMTRIVQRERYVPYYATIIVIGGAIGCIKHLIRLHQWHALIIVGLGYVLLSFYIGILWRYRRQGENIAVQYIAGFGLSSMCVISVIFDFAIGALKQ